MALDSSFYLSSRRTNTFFSLSKQCLRELKCFAWHCTVEMGLRWRRWFYPPLLTDLRAPLSLSSEARALPCSQGPLSTSCSHTIILVYSQINLFHRISALTEWIRCLSGNTLYSSPPHVLMPFVCLEGSLPHLLQVKILAALCVH